jgi:hypothetical protein
MDCVFGVQHAKGACKDGERYEWRNKNLIASPLCILLSGLKPTCLHKEKTVEFTCFTDILYMILI